MPAHEPSEKDKLSILMSFVREHEYVLGLPTSRINKPKAKDKDMIVNEISLVIQNKVPKKEN